MKNYDEDIDKSLKWLKRSENKMKFGSTFLIGFVLIVIVFIGGLLLHESYKSLQFDSEINSTLLRKFNNQGISYIKLNTEKKFKFRVYENSNYSPSYFIEFIKRGDNVLKNCNSDTLYIHRENKVYYFIIKEYLKE
ncbi:MAG: hypothetical protein V2I54_01375 [Bacteroidales bacterium]|jgi:hypothetical protein|nr:hypothetical protein [Bacteroidales bacterium]